MPDLSCRPTQADFGYLVGISQQSVSDLIQRGVLAPNQTAGQWLLAYCEHLREVATGRGADGELAFQRTELARVARERNEIQLAKDRKEFAAVALLNQVVAQVGQSVADHLERLPDEIEHTCAALGPEHMAVIRRAVGKAQHLAKTATLSDHENTDPTDNPSDPESAIP